MSIDTLLATGTEPDDDAPKDVPLNRRKRRAARKAPTAPPEPTDGALVARERAPWDAPGGRYRASHRRAARGFYAPRRLGSMTTTRQAEILQTALIAPSTGVEGVTNGIDALSRYPINHDAITAYRKTPREITSPNSLVAGDVGAGKSSFVKTVFLLRPLVLERRRAVVYDKKRGNNGEEGEYADVARRFGVEPIRFTTDGTGTRLNLMDPLILAGTGAGGQKRLLETVVRLGRGDVDLDQWELRALRDALRKTRVSFDAPGARTPVLTDLMLYLGRPTADDLTDLSAAGKERLHQAGMEVRFTLENLIDEYGGLIDGETSSTVSLGEKLTSFDISQLPDDGPAVPVVMAVANQWLMGRLTSEPGWTTNVIWEEGWHAIGGPTAKLLRSTQKLSRSLGIGNVFVFHKGNDVPKDSPGYSMIQEAQTVYVYRLERPDEAEWATQTFGFASETTSVIQSLPNGSCVFKYGGNPETQMQHVRSDWETEVTNTDAGLGA